MLQLLYTKVKFSGIWLDMNEVANFCEGPCVRPNNTGFDYTYDLPYTPGNGSIESGTVSLNSTHYGNISEANVHAFFAFLETAATHTFL
jgi:lysosomal alpha-glucosidase